MADPNGPPAIGLNPTPAVFYQKFTLLLTPAIVNTIVVAEQTFTPPANINLPVGALVLVNPPAINGAVGPCYAARRSATTIGIGWVNPTAGNITPTATQLYEVIVISPKA